MAFGALTLLLLLSLSGPTMSDESLLAELTETRPQSDIWPQIIECEDCLMAGGPFAHGTWRVIDFEKCPERREASASPLREECFDQLEWSQEGVFHPAYSFRWKARTDDDVDRIEFPVFLGDVSALFGRKDPDPHLYLIQRSIYGGRYRLVEAEQNDDLIRKLTEFPLSCEDAPKDSWQRLGFRFHSRSLDVWRGDYCEIRDLRGFRNLARKALARPPSALWEHVANPPGIDEP